MDQEILVKYEDDKKLLSTNITYVVAQKTSSTPSCQGNNNYSRNLHEGANSPPNNRQWQAQPYRPQRNNQQQPFNKNLCFQLCDRKGHSAMVCESKSPNHLQARANFVGRFPP